MGIFSQLAEEDQKRQQAKNGQPVDKVQRVTEQQNAPEETRGKVKRASFELYPEQLKALKQFSLEDQLNGESGSMSAMVREALDKYILERNRRKGRTPE